jgi:protein phosphatase methylesterase 1
MKAHCDIAAFDMRGHGESIDCGADEVDWSTDRLCADAVTVLRQLMTTTTSETKPRPAPASASASAYDDQTTAVEPRRYQRVVIVGHSMGGAIAARVAHAVPKEWLGGLVLIDVVEGTALEALPAMQRVISNRPTSFPDIATAIRWAKANHISSNLISARVSLPSQLRSTSSSPSVEPQQQQQHDHHGSTSFVWKVALKNTEPFWRDWFTGLSACFLGAQCPKLLLLAGTDRLDKALMIGQMQGKFQLELLPQAGHAVQEDEPEATAAKLLQFLQRHRLYQR